MKIEYAPVSKNSRILVEIIVAWVRKIGKLESFLEMVNNTSKSKLFASKVKIMKSLFWKKEKWNG